MILSRGLVWILELFDGLNVLPGEGQWCAHDHLCPFLIPADLICDTDKGPCSDDRSINKGHEILIRIVGSSEEEYVPPAGLEFELHSLRHIP